MRPASPRRIQQLLDRRTEANARFFDAEHERIAGLCHRMAERFARGGRLVAFGRSPADRSDVRHLAVELVHPVFLGRRPLPAIGLSREGGSLPRQVDLLARPDDVAIAFGAENGDPQTLRAVEIARRRGCLTVAFGDAGAEWELAPPTDDPFVRQELVETLYHVLSELVHVFFEHQGLPAGQPRRRHGAGASSFLHPFLGQSPDRVVADVAATVRTRAQETSELRQRTLEESAATLRQAARELRRRFASGGKLLAMGNGGSATDAMDLVADLRSPPRDGEPLPAIDLTEDAAILTALADDIGSDVLFSRQVVAYGQQEDTVVALSTSGSSRNVLAALAESRRRGLVTVAFVGNGGGRIAEERLADYVIVTPSEHVSHIQEAQASCYHILCELVREAQGSD
jgi:D-sedoheptulose 7-phosphate isomerase